MYSILTLKYAILTLMMFFEEYKGKIVYKLANYVGV